VRLDLILVSMLGQKGLVLLYSAAVGRIQTGLVGPGLGPAKAGGRRGESALHSAYLKRG